MQEIPEIKIKLLFDDAVAPERAYSTDSGLDLRAHKFEKYYTRTNEIKDIVPFYGKTLVLGPLERVLINTGIAATVGKGYEIQIRPRSGLAVKKGFTVLNTPGTIDEQYRGAICVILVNLSGAEQHISLGERIAQMVVCPVSLSKVKIVEDLSETSRGSGGFGHSGV